MISPNQRYLNPEYLLKQNYFYNDKKKIADKLDHPSFKHSDILTYQYLEQDSKKNKRKNEPQRKDNINREKSK